MLSARRIKTLACVSVIALTLAGCSTQATSAALVGDQAISEQAIFDGTAAVVTQDQTDDGSAPGPTELAYLNRLLTTSAIRSELLAVAAADRAVEVTQDQVNAELSGGGGVANLPAALASLIEQGVRDQLVIARLIAAAGSSGVPIQNVSVRLDGVSSVQTSDEAEAIRAQLLADPQSADAIIATSANPLQPQEITVVENVDLAPSGVFSAEPGEVVVAQRQQSSGYFVLRILDRDVEPGVLTAADLTPQQAGGTVDPNLAALMLVPYAEQVGVTVNPRFGAWDPLTLQVVPGGSGQ